MEYKKLKLPIEIVQVSNGWKVNESYTPCAMGHKPETLAVFNYIEDLNNWITNYYKDE